MNRKRKKLRTGFTTGTAAAAAVKGALCLLFEGKVPFEVQIELLTGDHINIPLHTCESEGEKTAKCTVIKDAGDDPDITHQAEIGARVMLLSKEDDNGNKGSLKISGGKGVGKVTKPGLEISPGEPAINPGPRKMITQAAREVFKKHNKNMPVQVEIFVPEGESLAKKTLNERLGILGGISILGTTGIVSPMSHDAYIATIRSSLSVAHAAGLERVIFTTGRRSERFSQALWNQLPEEAFIQIGDFFQMSLDAASKMGFGIITLAVFFGKAVKMAQGVPHTHAAKSSLTMHKLSDWAFEITKNSDFAEKILSANTARHAFDFILREYPAVISHVGNRMVKSAKVFAGQNVHIRGVIFDYSGNVIFDSENLGLRT
jgi:cobalt-precorrin-5B (C1)-methyltransferase